MTRQHLTVPKLFTFLIFVLSSCTTLGYDPHTKPIPPQPGKSFTLIYGDKKGIVIPLYTIEKPVNHESGWDTDDVILVFKNPLITLNTASSWAWKSDSWWTGFRFKHCLVDS